MYIGVTSNLERRVYEHKNKLVEGFTQKYNVNKLVCFESTNDVLAAIEREKQIKKWRREKKSVGDWDESGMEGFEFGVGERFLLAVEMTKLVIPNLFDFAQGRLREESCSG